MVDHVVLLEIERRNCKTEKSRISFSKSITGLFLRTDQQQVPPTLQLPGPPLLSLAPRVVQNGPMMDN